MPAFTQSDQDEASRLAALAHYAILDTAPEADFDRLTRLTARIFQVPIVLVSLVDEHRQWFKSCYGLDLRQTDRSASFCAHALGSNEVLVVPDATRDDRFVDNPLVIYEPHIRFYAGAPLVTSTGQRLGTLCVIDTVPHADFTPAEQETLQDLAASVMSELELRSALADRRHSEAVNAAILAASLDAIITLDAQGLITEWNPVAERMSGYARADVLGRSAHLLVGEVNDEVSGQQFWTFLQAQALERTDRFSLPIRHRDGRTFPGEVTLLTLEVNEQRLYTLLIRDLTFQEAARAELSSQRNLLQAVLDGVPEAIYVKDLQRRFLMINTTGAKLLGRPVEEILGHTDEEMQTAEAAAATRLRDEQVLQSGHRVGYEVTDQMPDGTHRTFLTRKLAYRDSEDQVAGLIGVSIDITERKADEVAIRRYSERLAHRVEDAQLEILQRLAQAAEYRDDDTGEHMTRVGEMAARLARQLGLPEDEIKLIRRTAPLHDVGKVGIPDGVLLKPGRLTAEEFEMIKTHSQIGAQILQGSGSKLVQMAEVIARTHHERWDGTGYPEGLSGLAIPLVGRIVAVADVLDALTSERPYKQAWSLSAAVAEIETQAGRQFDPQIVAALRRLLASGESVDAVGSAGERTAD